MTLEALIAAVALITGTCIGLGSLYFGVRHGNATLHQAAQQGQTTEQALSQVIRLMQDQALDLEEFRREARTQHETIRNLISAEAERIRTHSTQGHFDTRQVIRDSLGHR